MFDENMIKVIQGGRMMENTALLIVDVQNALVDEKPFNVEVILSNINELLDTCRTKGIEVIYVQHDGEKEEGLEPFSNGWDIHKSIYPVQGEKIIRKTYNSAFKNTELEEYLNCKNIQKLILVGMQTEYCIDTTCRVAFEKGYRLIMPEYTNTTFNNGNLHGSEVYEYHNHRIFKDRFAEVKSLNEIIKRIKL
jgi:nicotinamidase-related amidase